MSLRIELGNEIYVVKGTDFYTMLDAVKRQAGRKWDPERKLWVIPGDPKTVIANIEGSGTRVKGKFYSFNIKVLRPEEAKSQRPASAPARRQDAVGESDIPAKVEMPNAEFGIGELGRVSEGMGGGEEHRKPLGKLTGKRCDRCGCELGKYDAMVGSLGTYCPDCYDIAESGI